MDLQISLAPETIFHIGSLPVTNSMLAGTLLTVIFCVAGIIIGRSLKPIPGTFQNILELVYGGFLNLTETIIGRRDVAELVFPYVITLFLFILFSYWFGLIPGVSTFGLEHTEAGKNTIIPLFRSPVNDINMVGAFACISMAYVQVLGVKFTNLKSYLTKFFNFRNPLGFVVGILELVTEINRLISFTFRLFGNVFAGEVLVAVILYLTTSLVPFVAILPAPFLLIEIAVAIIQAFVFSFLTIVLISLAVSHHDAEGHVHGGEEVGLADNTANLQAKVIHS